jgi:hypothetical protein
MKKIMSFDNFKLKNIKEGLDDGIEEIVPEGLPGLPENENDAIEEIKEFLNNEPDDDQFDAILELTRDTLTEMEQMGFVEDNFTDELDDKYGDDWSSWIIEVIELPDFPEEGLNNIMEIINNISAEDLDLDLDDDLDEDDLDDEQL